MDGYKAVPQHATNSSRLAQGEKGRETKEKGNRNSERTDRGTGKKEAIGERRKEEKVSLNNIAHHSLARFNHHSPAPSVLPPTQPTIHLPP
jgi:hypothetical protein